MAELPSMASQDRLPLINYAKRHAWGNPQLNQQYQVRLARVSHSLGYSRNFVYMGKYYLLPESNRFYNVFTLGRLDAGHYGFGSRVFNWLPFDRWVNAKEYIEKRHIILDFYNEQGLMYNRTETWIMQCFNGTTLVAFVKNNVAYPMPVDKPMYMHCYTPDANNDGIKGYLNSRPLFEVSGITYYDFRDWDKIKEIYTAYKARGYGKLTVWHNGLSVVFENIKPAVGDLIELFLDPSVEKSVTFKYSTLTNYYSERDKKSKVILFPWFNNPNKQYYYFDDCDFFVYNRRTKKSIYLHRNNQDCVRQLTHQDYGVAGDYVETAANYLISIDTTKQSKMSDIDIVVVYHRIKWLFYLGPTSSRIAELYLLEDATKILNAMSGPKSTIKEWQAASLEQSGHNRLLGREYLGISNDDVYHALGYNGCSNVLSNTLFYMPGIMPGDSGYEGLYTTPNFLSGSGYLVPPSYRVSSTVYEYDKDGHLYNMRTIKFVERYIPSKEAVFCEYALGPATTWLDATLTKTKFKVNPDYGFRVYRAPWRIGESEDEETVNKFWQYEWSISQDGQPLYQTGTVVNLPTQEADTSPDTGRVWDGGELAGEWEDITDTEYYTFDKSTGYITWNMNMNNYVGMVVSDSKHLYFEVDVEHLNKSLSFSLINMWEVGGILLPIRPAQVDIWMDNQPLIENVDYIFDFPTVHIVNKQHLVEGQTKYTFKARATGLAKEGPLPRSELGFVNNGVIGYNGRYNIRINRPTKTVCNGRIFLTQSIDWAETKGHGTNFNGLEGFPYEVKHYVCLNKYVENYTSQKGLEEDEERDVRMSAYLTTYATYKPKTPPIKALTDKYLVFSPFLSQLYNEMHLGFITIPDGEVTDQMVNLVSQELQFLLKYDPCLLNFDDAYFEVHPCANIGYQPITAKQLQILEKANTLFLKDRIRVRGHFEVTNE